MTPEQQKSQPAATVTADRVAWFAEYKRRNYHWGVFPGMREQNFAIGADGGDRSMWEASTREAAVYYDALTLRQRERLHLRVQDELDTVHPGMER